jgi:formate dehydrogenase subunit gamma
MTAVPPAGRAAGEVERFDPVERLVHWTTAILLISLLATGTILYVPSLMLRVGHRATVVNIHVITGLALVAPIVIGLAGRWRSGLVDDVRRLDRWSRADFAYFRRQGGSAGESGKFNGGQKLAAALFAGGGLAMVVTGVVMRWSPPFPHTWASGATLVHDIVYVVLFALTIGHVVMALSRPVQLRSMFTGRVPVAWAHRHPADPPPPRPSAARDAAAPAGTTPASD